MMSFKNNANIILNFQDILVTICIGSKSLFYFWYSILFLKSTISVSCIFAKYNRVEYA